MKTAMQELFDEMTSINWHLYSYEDKIKIINVHLEKEKEQIADAFRNGSASSMLGGGHWTQYYNQKYK